MPALTVAIVGLGDGAKRTVPGLKGADTHVLMDDPADLVALFHDLAERSMRAAAGR